MNNWLKYLIAAACFVVIAGGGVFAVQAVQSARAKAEVREWMAVRAECKSSFEKAVKAGGRFDGLERCLMRGAIDVPAINRILIANGRPEIGG